MGIWLKSGKNIGHSARRSKYVLSLPGKLIRHKSALFDLG